MKKVLKTIQSSLLALTLVFSITTGNAQTISTHFFGENAWMPDTIGNTSSCQEPPCILNGKLHKEWTNIKNMGTSIIRFGGIAADRNMPTNYQYIRMIDSVRAKGIEPIIQVPFCNYRYTAQQAADIVTYLNVTKKMNIKYWIIANEPDLGYSYKTSAQIAAYFRPFASAMKAVDPSILIIGPEISSFNRTIMDGLTTANGPDDITGKDASGRFYLDIISFHTYPFNGSQTRSQVVSNLTSAYNFDANLAYLNGRVAVCNSTHGRTGTSAIKTAVTEANINWQNGATDNLNGTGANSFIGGQFIAEMLGLGMKNGVDFINIWSVIEGGSVASNIGFIDPTTYKEKPAYFHFKLMADNFKGSYTSANANQTNVKSFACKNGQETTVMMMNEDLSTDFKFTVRLNTDKPGATNPLTVNVNAGIANEYVGTIINQSTILLTFNSSGQLIRKYEYSLQNNAMASIAPTYTEFAPTGIAENATASAVSSNNFEFRNVYPNPAPGNFTISLNKGAMADEQQIEVQLINLLGQQVYNMKHSFLNGKEEIQLPPDIANGEYLVRVKEGDKDNYLVKKVLIQKN